MTAIMFEYKIAYFDVYYRGNKGKVCCIVFENEPRENIISSYCKIVTPVDEYISGEFYKRELPCILGLYENIKENIDLIIVDGYVLLSKNKKGLGYYLYEALNGEIPVIGVAKTYFNTCVDYGEIYRGESKRPLYITSVGINLKYSCDLVQNLKGKYRIPDILKKVDQLTRMPPS